MKTDGLSLIEVLVAVGMLLVVVTGISAGMSSSMSISRESRLNSQAAQYAQMVLEEYRSNWNSPNVVNSTNSSGACYQQTAFACNQDPSLTNVESKLPTFMNIAVTKAALDSSGATFTGTGIPAVRRVHVEVKHGSKVRARLETRIGRNDQ